MKLRHAFAFVPWLAALSHSGNTIVDHAKVQLGLGKDCAHIQKTFTAEIARSLAAREKGLGGRKKPLTDTEGMLFLFNPPQRVAFWMKDTWIPLQIGYFNTAGRLSSGYDMPVEANPTQPGRNYVSTEETSAALEVAPHALDQLLGSQLCLKKN